ncbi:MAG: GntR family transcriptional regulator, partial [Lentisphaeria bacterium]|nr:GntR family transcriptional regulator [Lentisphaeria bacterium]
PHKRIASERKLAKQYELSHMTVRRITKRLAHEKLIYKVQGKGMFTAEQPANSQDIRETILYANDWPQPEHPYVAGMFSGILKHASQDQKIQVIQYSGSEINSENSNFLKEIAFPGVRGIILSWLSEDLYQLIKTVNPDIRIVFTLPGEIREDTSFVGWDRQGLKEQMRTYLISQQKNNLLFIDSNPETAAGTESAQSIVFENDPASGFENMIANTGYNMTEFVQKIMERNPEGIAFSNDYLAHELLWKIRAVKPDFFERTAVVSLANKGSNILPPEAARLEISGLEVGTMAIQTLKAMITDDTLGGSEIIIRPRLVPPKLEGNSKFWLANG